ncbi:type II toxin-antitoxin system RelE/ParE family toxin [Candidatus Daviesbacteria bacterium]|nr:type II toxin-antitoxin system RelE/ParE family toxin [Candidatus Daviesbacteria bacterium]
MVVFYVEENGNEPVRKFLSSLDLKTQARFNWSIEQLKIRNVTAREPLVRHLEDKIWELREESSTNIFRLLYFFFTGKQIVFVHGFVKKKQKTSRSEIKTALERMKDFSKRYAELEERR